MGIAVRGPVIDGYREVAPGEIAAPRACTPVAWLGFWSGIASAVSSVLFTVGAGLEILVCWVTRGMQPPRWFLRLSVRVHLRALVHGGICGRTCGARRTRSRY
jgi:hypothetical protein